MNGNGLDMLASAIGKIALLPCLHIMTRYRRIDCSLSINFNFSIAKTADYASQAALFGETWQKLVTLRLQFGAGAEILHY
jgi:hypothetical protein